MVACALSGVIAAWTGRPSGITDASEAAQATLFGRQLTARGGSTKGLSDVSLGFPVTPGSDRERLKPSGAG